MKIANEFVEETKLCENRFEWVRLVKSLLNKLSFTIQLFFVKGQVFQIKLKPSKTLTVLCTVRNLLSELLESNRIAFLCLFIHDQAQFKRPESRKTACQRLNTVKIFDLQHFWPQLDFYQYFHLYSLALTLLKRAMAGCLWF